MIVYHTYSSSTADQEIKPANTICFTENKPLTGLV